MGLERGQQRDEHVTASGHVASHDEPDDVPLPGLGHGSADGGFTGHRHLWIHRLIELELQDQWFELTIVGNRSDDGDPAAGGGTAAETVPAGHDPTWQPRQLGDELDLLKEVDQAGQPGLQGQH